MRSESDPTAKCRGVNPSNQEWRPVGGSEDTVNWNRQLLQPTWCQMYCYAFLWTTPERPRGGFRATQFLHTIAQACALERLLQCRCISDRPTRSYKSWAHWRKLGRYGLFPTVGGAITPHWSAIARLKQGSPRLIRCWPVTVCLLQWVLEAQDKIRREDWKPCTRQNKTKK